MNYGRPLINGLFSSRVSSMPTNVKAPLLGLGGSICLFAASRSFFSKTASSSAKAAENLPKVFFDVKVWLGEKGSIYMYSHVETEIGACYEMNMISYTYHLVRHDESWSQALRDFQVKQDLLLKLSHLH